MKEILNKDFNIFFGEEVFEKLLENLRVKDYTKLFVLMDTNTRKHCSPILRNYLKNYIPILIPVGESNKTIQQAEFIWKTLLKNLADRKSVLINLGGGMVSDMGGFCASTYKRGIDFINIPTSLLGMVDAAIGGKQGIDLDSNKNMIGVFNHPESVFIYPPFLNTLVDSEIRNGFAEIIKHALICDKILFEKLEKLDLYDRTRFDPVIFQSVMIKFSIVSRDPFEKNIRKKLNFGHTIGHAIETLSLLRDKNPLKHGEAIAIGMICEAFLSNAVEGLSNKEFNHITELILNRFPKYEQKWNAAKLIRIMKNDKKNIAGNINFTLLKKIGLAKIDQSCNEDLIVQSLNYYHCL